jgi:tetratricopeptide (TPR) repeat protein
MKRTIAAVIVLALLLGCSSSTSYRPPAETPPATENACEMGVQEPAPEAGSEATVEKVEKLTDALEKQRLIDEAAAHIDGQKWIIAESALKSLLKTYPGDAEVLYQMGRFYHEQQRYEEAAQYLYRAVEIDAAHARAQYLLGKISLHSAATSVTDEEVRFTNTEMRFKKAIEAEPQLAEAHNDLGTLYFEKKRFDEALACFGTAIDADSVNKIYLYNYARTAFELGKYDETIDFCQKALKIDENFPHPYWFIAKSYTKQKNWEQTCVYWQKVIDKFGFDKRLQAQAVIELKNAEEKNKP